MASSSQSRGEFETAVAEAVIAQVRTVLPKGMGDTLSLDTPLVELGLDSLKIMEVINHTETLFGVRFREEWLYDLETCRNVAVCVAANLPQGVALPQPAPGLEAARPEGRAGGSIPSQHYDVTQFPECVALDRRLAEAAEAGLVNPFFRCNEAVCRPLARIDGREVVNYTSFDYLGLASHTAVIAAAKEALDQFGTSASASRLVGGDNTLLRQLDEEIARFLGTEAAIVFPSGYGTNASLFGHLFGSEDLILHDALAHNSIVQGSLLSRAHRTAFPHNDADALDALLRDIRGEYRRVVVAVEGVYSMDGDYPDLPRFLEIKRRHKALCTSTRPIPSASWEPGEEASANTSASIPVKATSGWVRSARLWRVAAGTWRDANRWSVTSSTRRRLSSSPPLVPRPTQPRLWPPCD